MVETDNDWKLGVIIKAIAEKESKLKDIKAREGAAFDAWQNAMESEKESAKLVWSRQQDYLTEVRKALVADRTVRKSLAERLVQVNAGPGPSKLGTTFVKNKEYGLRNSPPSAAASFEKMRFYQQESADAPFYYNYRPSSAQALPASLVEPAYGRFLDTVAEGRVDWMSCDCAAQLSQTLSEWYHLEDKVRNQVNDILSDFVGKTVTVKTLRKSNCDGILDDPLRLIVEVKLSIAATRSDPNAEATHYYHDFVNDKIFGLTKNFTHAALTLEVISNSIKVNAAFVGGEELGRRVCSEPLTDYVVCSNFLRSQPARMKKLASTLYALKEALGALETLHKEYAANPSSRDFSANVPYPIRDRFDTVNWLMTRDYNGAHIPIAARKLLFLGEKGDQSTIVKFTPSPYKTDLHQRLADLDLCPKLYKVTDLPGSWSMVEMEFLKQSEGWQCLAEGDLAEKDNSSLFKTVERSLLQLHQAETGKFAHADFRPNNLMVNLSGAEPQVRIIDLDAAGEEGKDTYGAYLNPMLSWPSEAGPGLPVQQGHDVELLRKTWPAYNKWWYGQQRRYSTQPRCQKSGVTSSHTHLRSKLAASTRTMLLTGMVSLLI